MTQEASSIQDLDRVFARAAKDIAYHLEHHVKNTDPVEKQLLASDVLIGAQGEVKQVKKHLRLDGGYCAIGVLGFNAGIELDGDSIAEYFGILEAYGIPSYLMSEIWVRNDSQGKTFKEIGEWLKGLGY